MVGRALSPHEVDEVDDTDDVATSGQQLGEHRPLPRRKGGNLCSPDPDPAPTEDRYDDARGVIGQSSGRRQQSQIG